MSGSWVTLPLSKVCIKITDGTHHSPTVQFQEPGENRYRYVTSKNLRPWGLDLTDIDYVDEKTHREIYSRCNPEKGDVLLTKDGANTGMVAVNTLDEEFSLLSSVAVLKPDPTMVESRYLRYFIESPEGSNRLTGKMTGTAIRRIILKQIKEAEIFLAPLPEQRRIVAEIEKQFTRLDAGVAALRRVQANLKRYRAAVLKAACEGRLVPTEAELAMGGPRKATFETGEALLARVLTERRQHWQGRGQYKEPTTPDTSKLGSLPKGWTWAGLDQLLSVMRNGISAKPDAESGLPILRISAVRALSVNLAETRYLNAEASDYPDYALTEGDLLFTRYNGNPELVGVCGVVPPLTLTFVHPDKLIRCKLVSSGALPNFVAIMANVGASRDYLAKRVRTTAGQAGISGGDLKGLPIPLAPFAEQTRIVAEVERRLSMVAELEASVSANLQRAARLRQSILQKAFSGELA